MIVTSICAIKEQWNLPDFFNSLHICPHNFSLHTLSLYFFYLTRQIVPHIYASIKLSSISEEKTGSTRCKPTLEV